MITPPTAIELPVQRGAVTVRQGSLEDDLDAVHVGDPVWWGRDFIAERIASSTPGTPYTMLVGELDGRPAADAFVLGLGVNAKGYAMADLFVLPGARGRGVGRAVRDALTASTRAYGLPGWMVSTADDDHRDDGGVGRRPGRRGRHGADALRRLPGVLPAPGPRAARLARRPPGRHHRSHRPAQGRRGQHVLHRRGAGRPRWGPLDRLKARHALLLLDRGERRLYTQNMDQNAPILAANARLGFHADTGFYDYGLAVAAETR